MSDTRQHVCPDCDVSWPASDGPACWCCGKTMEREPFGWFDTGIWRKGGVPPATQLALGR